MNKSESIKELATALAKAQGQIEGAKRDSENPHFRSKYADLASVWDACREALSANGLSIVQMPGKPVAIEGGQWLIPITTMLMHESGEWIAEEGGVMAVKADGQAVVAATTYGRRNGVSAFAGVAPEDDDGESAVGRETVTKHHPPKVVSGTSGKSWFWAVVKGLVATQRWEVFAQVEIPEAGAKLLVEKGPVGDMARTSLMQAILKRPLSGEATEEEYKTCAAYLVDLRDGALKV